MIYSNYQKEQIEQLRITGDVEKDTTALIKKWLIYNEHLRAIFKKCASSTLTQANGFGSIDFESLNDSVRRLLFE